MLVYDKRNCDNEGGLLSGNVLECALYEYPFLGLGNYIAIVLDTGYELRLSEDEAQQIANTLCLKEKK